MKNKFISTTTVVFGLIFTGCEDPRLRFETVSNYVGGVVIDKKIDFSGNYIHHQERNDTAYYLTIKYRPVKIGRWCVKKIRVKKFEFNYVKEGDTIK